MYREILQIIRNNGYEAYLVGGSVRDMLMDKQIYDYDICTNAFPADIKRVFCDYTVIETGIKHGTVTVLYKKIPFEITTYRGEKGYTDGRHPDKVIFGVSLEEDLKRRDFTVNAICFDGISVYDPLNGTADIQRRIIRAVGNPEQRFKEDGLRILRGLRFASQLDFELDGNTAQAMRKSAPQVQNVSSERIFAEFKKMAEGKAFNSIYKEYYDIIACFIPYISPIAQIYESAEQAEKSLKALKADKQSILLALAYYTDKNKSVIELLKKHGTSFAEFICRKTHRYDEYKAVIQSGMPYKVTMLKVDGNDISKITDTRKNIGIILDKLLDSVISGETENKREILLKKAVDISAEF